MSALALTTGSAFRVCNNQTSEPKSDSLEAGRPRSFFSSSSVATSPANPKTQNTRPTKTTSGPSTTGPTTLCVYLLPMMHSPPNAIVRSGNNNLDQTLVLGGVGFTSVSLAERYR